MINWIKKIFKLTNFKRFFISAITIISTILVIVFGSFFYVSKNVNKSIEYGGGVEVLVKVKTDDSNQKTSDNLVNTVRDSLQNRLTGGTGLNGITVSNQGESVLRITRSGSLSNDELKSFEREIVNKPILTITDTEMRPLFQKEGDTIAFVKDAPQILELQTNINKWIPPFSAAKAEIGPTGQWSVLIDLTDSSAKTAWFEATSYIASLPMGKNKMLIWLNINDLIKKAQDEFPDQWAKANFNLWNFIHIDEMANNPLKEHQIKAKDYLISDPSVQQGIDSDKTVINGSFNQTTATKLATGITFGLSNYSLNIEQTNYIDSSKNQNSFNYAMIAGIVIFSAIALFMIINYGLLGALSTISMALYIFLTLLMFSVLRGEYSPSTLAALIIGIGISVDANVITYERLKRQVYQGDSFRKSYKNSNRQSLSSIMDANITTIIVGFILFYFGTINVKGFSIILVLSVLFTLLVMLVFQRSLATLIVNSGFFDNRTYLLGIRKKYINNKTKLGAVIERNDFLKQSKWFALGSMIFILISVIIFASLSIKANDFWAGVNRSIEFSGGTYITIAPSGDTKALDFETASKIKQAIIEQNPLNLTNINHIISINKSLQINNQDSYILLIKTNQTIAEAIKPNINSLLTATIDTIPNLNLNFVILPRTVSITEANHIVQNATIAISISFIGIVLYLLLRMSWTFSFAAIIGLIHDFLMVVAFIVITRLQVSSIVVAAMLSILGLSINDTVVTFDKIRETINTQYVKKILTKEDIKHIVNTSIAETLKRSLYTSFTTIFAIVVLLCFQNATDFTFNIVMLFGITIGVYSSIFICTWFWSKVENLRQKGIRKRIESGYWNINNPEEQTFNGINDYVA
ncbi:protein translocase subunit SecDF [Mycoplasma sp. NEAQ87857]|uniref:protein translocase subunit SecDF n=1 Tax=Mycoplasma sp. NEAQ87857 TaxID=2683967 RepID=UPI001315BCB4|nr:protein translocase subunit SecDF [Mycoplasma sp. NEAQ87857]QGZ97451.1 protein translocase subunit SecDF [Mycoplasma sp. NEAQ87857]